MDLQLVVAPVTAAEGEWLIVGVTEGSDLSGSLGTLDKALGGQLSRLREANGDEKGDLTARRARPRVAGNFWHRSQAADASRLGSAEKITAASLERAFITAARQISTKATRRISVAIPTAGLRRSPWRSVCNWRLQRFKSVAWGRTCTRRRRSGFLSSGWIWLSSLESR